MIKMFDFLNIHNKDEIFHFQLPVLLFLLLVFYLFLIKKEINALFAIISSNKFDDIMFLFTTFIKKSFFT